MGLLSKEVYITLTAVNINYYEASGYEMPRRKDKQNKMTVPRGTKIVVKVEDLSPRSSVKVLIQCDCCNKEYETPYYSYNTNNHEGRFYCNNCKSKVLNSGENHCKWDENKTHEKRFAERKLIDNQYFIKKVFKRDNYTCQCCGQYKINIEAHHLDGYDWCIEKRFDETNGITLCGTCHKNFHSVYGYGNNIKEQYEEWIGQAIEILKYEGELPTTRKVYCIEEDKIYNSVDELAKEWNCSTVLIYSVCNHKLNCKRAKKKHILWLHEYEKMTKEDMENFFKYSKTKGKIGTLNERSRKIICINDFKIFNCGREAEEYYKISNLNITSCCQGKYNYSGELNDGTKLVWMYYEEYLNLSKEEINKKIGELEIINKNKHSKSVICTTTNKIFNDKKDACVFYNIKSYKNIFDCCDGKTQYCGKLEDGTRLLWMYYSDYINK